MKLRVPAASIVALALGAWFGWAIIDEEEDPTGNSSLPPKSARRDSNEDRSAATTRDKAEADRVGELENPLERLRAGLQLAGTIPDGTLMEWLDHGYFKTGDRLLDDLFRRIVQERLLAIDPERALRLALRKRGRAGRELFADWLQDDPDAAAAFLLAPGGREITGGLATIALKEWVKTDPSRAVDLIDALTRRFEAQEGWVILRELQPLLESHRDVLLANARQWPSAWRRALHRQIAESRWEEDLAGTLQWLTEVEEAPWVFTRLLQNKADHSAEVFENLHLLPDGWLRWAEYSCGYALVRHNPMDWLKADARELGIDPAVLTKIQAHAAEQVKDVDVALRLLPDMPLPAQKALAVRTVDLQFYTNRAEAEACLATVEPPEARAAGQARFDQLERYRTRPNKGWGGSQFPGFASKPGPFRSMEQWDPEDLATTLQRHQSLPPEQRHKDLQPLVESRRPEIIPPALMGHALQFFLESADGTNAGSPAKDLSKKVISHAARWARLDPGEAAKWAGTLPDGEPREWALRNVAHIWAGQSPSEARSWATRLPSQIERTLVLEEVAASR